MTWPQRWCRDKYSKHAKIANKTKTPMVKLSHKSSSCSVSVPKVVPNPNLNINVYVMFAIFADGLICSHNGDQNSAFHSTFLLIETHQLLSAFLKNGGGISKVRWLCQRVSMPSKRGWPCVVWRVSVTVFWDFFGYCFSQKTETKVSGRWAIVKYIQRRLHYTRCKRSFRKRNSLPAGN